MLFALPCLLTMLTMSSCDDNKLAKQLNGTWQCKATLSNAETSEGEGIEKQTVYQQFKYVESNTEDGGTMKEYRDAEVKEVDLDDMTMDASYRVYVEGKWEIIAGDLYIYYNVSSLKLGLDADDITLHDDDGTVRLSSYAYILGKTTVDGLVEEMRQELYKEMKSQYCEDAAKADSAPYQDLKVSADAMSYKTSDLGTMHFTKSNMSLDNIN